MTYSVEIRTQAIALYKKGLFVSEIAKSMKIPFGTLAGWIYSETYTVNSSRNLTHLGGKATTEF